MESHPMNGGEGPTSYAMNSIFQRNGVSATTAMIEDAIARHISIDSPSNWDPIRIADLGCSVGPNTFMVVQSIVEAMELKYTALCKSHALAVPSGVPPEFQVFFNDHVTNDFNTLIASLPCDCGYFAATAPGSFFGRLFPRSSVHFVHCSYALHWMSQVPKEVRDENSPAWNKGRIFYGETSNEMTKAYAAQYAKDISCFLEARAQEIVYGGLMALLIPCRDDHIAPHEASLARMYNLLGSSLMDMVDVGRVDEADVDSFNVPSYFASPKELEALVMNNDSFTIERSVSFIPLQMHDINGGFRVHSCCMHMRAGLESVLSQHFGSGPMDELFDRFEEKVADNFPLFNVKGKKVGEVVFMLLKRKFETKSSDCVNLST